MRVPLEDEEFERAIERITKTETPTESAIRIFLERAERVYGYTPEKVKELEKKMRGYFAEKLKD